MPKSIILDRAKDFAVEIVNLCRSIKEAKRESILTNQLLRAATSTGANIQESKYPHNTADLLQKCDRTEYWPELLNRTGYIADEHYKPLLNHCGAIRRMLIPSINTAKKNAKR